MLLQFTRKKVYNNKDVNIGDIVDVCEDQAQFFLKNNAAIVIQNQEPILENKAIGVDEEEPKFFKRKIKKTSEE